MPRPLPRFAAVTVLLAVFIAGCGGAAATPSPTVISVKGTEYAYDPASISTKSGGVTTLRLTNAGVVEHDITVDALSFKLLVKPGETKEAALTNPKPGTYEFYCSIPGHKEAGMKGTLDVK
ncbi:MAG: hypothetical protein FJ038_11645 [Chloroflexi bacterium]|nr:hypothetical protein [Chloroflexota bacterium]